MRHLRTALCLVLALSIVPACTAAGAAGKITTPTEHLGRPPGADHQLADWKQVSSYYWKLAEQSKRVRTEKIGLTTDSRDFLISIISGEENLANLDQILADAALIADPRKDSSEAREAAIARGKLVMMISFQMHSTEAAGSEFGMSLAHHLATSEQEPWKSARKNIVAVFIPCTNPDGLDRVVGWYRRIVHTPHDKASMPMLYHHYAGHDNNRDWFMMSLAETRLVTRQIYHRFRPQVYWDVHQQGSGKERFFLPPYRDPLNPNIDAPLISAVNAIGKRAELDMTRQGLTGIATHSTYDNWFVGGNRNTPVRHNVIAFLTEAAGVELATPITQKVGDLKAPGGAGAQYIPSNNFVAPWPGGKWTLGDIHTYEMAFGKSFFASLSREPQTWMRTSAESASRSVAPAASSPFAWVIPADNRDPAAVHRMVDALMLGGVELRVASAPLKAGDKSFPAGSLVIPYAQPYGRYAKDLMERQNYPKGDNPYDVAGWTMPLLMGVNVVQIDKSFDLSTTRVSGDVEQASAGFTGDPRLARQAVGLWSLRHSDAWTRLAMELGKGRKVNPILTGDRAGMALHGNTAPMPGEKPLTLAALPRIGLFAPWSADMDEGWMRWVMDTMRIPYVSVRPKTLAAGDLSKQFDVLIFAGASAEVIEKGRTLKSCPEEYRGGAGQTGAAAIKQFVEQGGIVLAFDNSPEYFVKLFKLPLKESAKQTKGFECPGSVLATIPQSHALTADLEPVIPVMFSKSTGWTAGSVKAGGATMRSLLNYADQDSLLMSGFITKPEVMAGSAAWVRAEIGKGRVHLFGFRPQYRSWSQAAFHLMFRAMFLDGN